MNYFKDILNWSNSILKQTFPYTFFIKPSVLQREYFLSMQFILVYIANYCCSLHDLMFPENLSISVNPRQKFSEIHNTVCDDLTILDLLIIYIIGNLRLHGFIKRNKYKSLPTATKGAEKRNPKGKTIITLSLSCKNS